MRRQDKLKKLQSIFKRYKKVLIAFSGGVDSTFLLKVAVDSLGKKNVLSATAISQTYPKSDLLTANRIIEKLGIKNIFINTNELNNKDFVCNTPKRCFWCKNELFRSLSKIANKNKINVICDGTNYSDKDDYRPGMLASQKWNIRHPLLEAKMSKNEIRILSKKLGLPTWNKEISPCLASRFPYGQRITIKKLKKISNAENELKKLHLKNLRLRDYEDTARIEIDKDQLKKIFKTNIYNKIVTILKKYNYKYITLDLEGYRTGSLNQAIKKIF
ncbi:MAG: TIGR00268 family protein [Elusimicrobia bacterium RIFOXYC2_FULL_34_12]|nr:MAG: TIGR00268 family protein [Elusimicrobia bacterium RIFOXYC2_FULL_34_12]OGS39717.1 MAG: TIGR00268 family protein [Elusimicrobia bacterium RIFOXYD2_FULL_34_30]